MNVKSRTFVCRIFCFNGFTVSDRHREITAPQTIFKGKSMNSIKLDSKKLLGFRIAFDGVISAAKTGQKNGGMLGNKGGGAVGLKGFGISMGGKLGGKGRV